MSEQSQRAWWDIEPDEEKFAQCPECAALVLKTGLARHEEWHHLQREWCLTNGKP